MEIESHVRMSNTAKIKEILVITQKLEVRTFPALPVIEPGVRNIFKAKSNDHTPSTQPRGISPLGRLLK